MKRNRENDSEIVRLTRWVTTVPLPKKESKELEKDDSTTIYGVDRKGNEKVYATVSSEGWKEWSETDPLWREALKAINNRLFSNSEVRDGTLLAYLNDALKNDDKEMGRCLWYCLTDSTRAKIT